MIPLSAHGKAHRLSEPIIGKIASTEAGWSHRIQLREEWDGGSSNGFDAVLCQQLISPSVLSALNTPVVHGLSTAHLAEGDVVRLDERGHVRTLYRRASKFNALFATDRCSSLCLMCSQPPRKVDDDWRVGEMLRTIDLIDPATPELGITGGEPTLLKDGFLQVARACKEHLPNTSLHVLSNGRLFRYGSFAKGLAAIQHHDLMIGVPVYSDLEDRHDHVVQARGAFEDVDRPAEPRATWSACRDSRAPSLHLRAPSAARRIYLPESDVRIPCHVHGHGDDGVRDQQPRRCGLARLITETSSNAPRCSWPNVG